MFRGFFQYGVIVSVLPYYDVLSNVFNVLSSPLPTATSWLLMLCFPLTQYVIWCFTPSQPLRLSQGVFSTQKDRSVIRTCYQNVLPEQQQQQQKQLSVIGS